MAVRYGVNQEVSDILIIESKFSKIGVARLSATKSKGPQMGPEWIDKTLQDMVKQGGELRATADLIQENWKKVSFKGNVLNPEGLNRWKALTEQINQLHLKPKLNGE